MAHRPGGPGYPDLVGVIDHSDGRYTSKARVGVAGTFGLFAVLFLIASLPSQSASGPVVPGVLFIVCLVFALRAPLSFIVEVEPDQVTVKGLYRTRRFSYGDLDKAEAVEGLVMLKPRVYAAYRLKSGQVYRTKNINDSTRSRGTVDSMVRDINERIAASRRGNAVV